MKISDWRFEPGCEPVVYPVPELPEGAIAEEDSTATVETPIVVTSCPEEGQLREVVNCTERYFFNPDQLYSSSKNGVLKLQHWNFGEAMLLWDPMLLFQFRRLKKRLRMLLVYIT